MFNYNSEVGLLLVKQFNIIFKRLLKASDFNLKRYLSYPIRQLAMSVLKYLIKKLDWGSFNRYNTYIVQPQHALYVSQLAMIYSC